jgi:hypothetical protein
VEGGPGSRPRRRAAAPLDSKYGPIRQCNDLIDLIDVS